MSSYLLWKKIQLKSIHLIRPTYYLKITWLKSRVLRLAFIMYIKDKNDIKLKLLNNKKGRKNSRCTVFGVFFSAASCKKRHRKWCTWKFFGPSYFETVLVQLFFCFFQILQTSEVPNRRACSLRFFRFFCHPALLSDFKPACLINLENISSLHFYSVLLA